MSVERMPAAAIRRVWDLAVNIDFIAAAVLWDIRVDGRSWGLELFEGMMAVLSRRLIVK